LFFLPLTRIKEKYNLDENENWRVVDVEWATRTGLQSLLLLRRLLYLLHIPDAAGENESDDGLVSYAINNELYCCFKAAPHPYNSEFEFVERNGF
jgi:hypothetical protein